MLSDVALLVADRAAPFEIGVFCEVFGSDRSADGFPSYDFALCTERPGRIRTSSGFAIHVEHGLDRLASADLVGIPAWPAAVPPSKRVLQALRDVVARGGRVMSVCTGAYVLAEAGLLDGRRAATHWRYAADLAARYPAVDVDPNVLYVDEDPVFTSAGTAAGIDLCLHLVRRVHGVEIANKLARRMVVPPHRDGGQAQFVEAPLALPADEMAELLDWMLEHLAEPLPVERLARRARMSERTFARRFRASTGTTPHDWTQQQRVLLAQRLLEAGGLSVEEVARRSGFGSAATLRHHFARARGTSPRSYQRAFGRPA